MQWLKSAILAIFHKEQEWPCPDSLGPQKVSVKLFLYWVPMKIQKDWIAKLESAYVFFQAKLF